MIKYKKEKWIDVICPACNGLVWSFDFEDKEELKKNYGLKIDCCTDCDKPIAWCVNTVLRINKAKEPEV